MNKQQHIAYGIDTTKKFVKTTFVLEANGSKSISLGTYTSTDPPPQFALSYDPDNDDVAASISDLPIPDDGGEYRSIWFCHLDNYGDRPCKVTIKRRTA